MQATPYQIILLFIKLLISLLFFLFTQNSNNMNKILLSYLLITISTLTLSTSVSAEGFIKKEVYSFKDKNGNIVFTDKQPAKSKTFKTQTIEAANSTGSKSGEYLSQYDNNQNNYSNNEPYNKQQVVRVIVEDGSLIEEKSYKKKRILKRCKSFKKKLDYYTDKLRSGYKNSEYKKLEKNRKKYRDLLFNNCERTV